MPPQLLASNMFEAAYAATSDGIKAKNLVKSDPWNLLIPRLATLCGTTFESAHSSVLDEFRKIAAAKSPKAGSHGKFIVSAIGVASDAAPDATQVARVAALELLFHTYFHATKGEYALWIVAIPTNYTNWPHAQLKSTTLADMIVRLDAGTTEKFSETDRKHIAQAAQTGLAWTLKALAVLDDLKAGSPAMKKLRYWFGDAGTTDADLTSFAATLKAGLRKMANKLNGGTAVVTDFVAIRGSADVNDMKARAANAFVIAAEKQDVIYIEAGFFSKNAGNIFQKDGRHWARIMVHEMSHREAATVDKRYGWAGISPSTGKITSADAMVNADSWAIFVADAAGAMTGADIDRATNGV
jgi:hypothetical protein